MNQITLTLQGAEASWKTVNSLWILLFIVLETQGKVISFFFPVQKILVLKWKEIVAFNGGSKHVVNFGRGKGA